MTHSGARASTFYFARSRSTGKERDTESGNDYFGARYYSSNMGRFMSPDPMGIASGSLTNPQSLNLYSYALNNPLVNIDPTGMECVWDDGSYDDNNDPDSGSSDKCAALGGSWVDHSYFQATGASDWSSKPNPNLTCGGITPPSAPIDYSASAQANAAALNNNPISGTWAWYQAFKGNGTQDFKNTTNFPNPAFGDGANRIEVGNFNFGASVSAAGMSLTTGQALAGAGAFISNVGAQANFSMSQAAYMNGQYGGPSAPNPTPQAPPWNMGPGSPGFPAMASNGIMNQGDQVAPNENQAVAAGFLWQSLGCQQ